MKQVLLIGHMTLRRLACCLLLVACCLLLEVEVTVTPDGGGPVKFGAGDLVVFPAGMDCRWEVHQAVRKHYQFCD